MLSRSGSSVPNVLLLGRAGDLELRRSGGEAIAMGACGRTVPRRHQLQALIYTQARLYGPAHGRKACNGSFLVQNKSAPAAGLC